MTKFFPGFKSNAPLQAALYYARKNRLARIAAASGGGGETSLVTWDPAHVAAGLTLSADKLTVTNNNGGNNGVLATAGIGTGKLFYEAFITASGDPHYNTVGIAFTGTDTGSLYAGSGGIGVAAGGSIWADNSDQHVNIGDTVGHVLGQVADLDTLLFWARVDDGEWNADPTANPTTGVGGIPIPGGAGIYTPACSSSSGSAGEFEITADFGATAFAFTKPAGCTLWQVAA